MGKIDENKRTGLRAWIGQRQRDVDELGPRKAPWRDYWNEPSGKRREKKCGNKTLALNERDRIHAALTSGTYEKQQRVKWKDFRQRYLKDHGSRNAPRSTQSVRDVFNAFEKLMKPRDVMSVNTRVIDEYARKRLAQPGKKPGSRMSPATVNRDLRTLKAAFRKAKKWSFVTDVPDFEMVRDYEVLRHYMTERHLADILKECKHAELPDCEGEPFTAGAWWIALLITTYLTGWRIGETLDLEWKSVDLDAGTVRLKAATTKGKRDAIVRIHPLVVEFLRPLAGFGKFVFPWPHDRKTLDTEFHRLQNLAGIHLECIIPRKHECTETCHLYGFHDQRRAYATENHYRMSIDDLQAMMRHKNRSTTEGYIHVAQERTRDVVDAQFVPEGILKLSAGQRNGRKPRARGGSKVARKSTSA